MTNEIIQGIAATLYNTFGDGYEIYQNDVSQGLQEPCFFIDIVEDSRVRQIGKRWLHDVSIDIQYFPLINGSNEEMYGISEQLYLILEFITLTNGQMLRGFGMRSEITEGVLHFFVNYSVFLIEENDEENEMEDASFHTGVVI